MATQTQQRVSTSIAGAGNQSLNLADSGTMEQAPNRNIPRRNDDEDAFEPEPATGEGEISIPVWIRESSMMKIDGRIKEATEPVCFFEPLGYCQPGRLTNEFCKFHREFMFNVDVVDTAMMTRRDQHSIVYRVSTRRLIKFPTELSLQLSTIMTLPELCSDFEDFKASLNLGQFASNLQTTIKQTDKVNKIVAEHKAYIVRVFRLYTRNDSVGQIEDSKISQCMEMWIKNASNNLNRYQHDSKLLVLDGEGRLMWLQLNNCSIFTQMMALLYETPYVQAPSLDGIWLSLPSAVITYRNGLVLDCSKASHGSCFGTSMDKPAAYGDPATISLFRSDNQESLLFISDTYTPNKRICFSNRIDSKILLGRSMDMLENSSNGHNSGSGNNNEADSSGMDPEIGV